MGLEKRCIQALAITALAICLPCTASARPESETYPTQRHWRSTLDLRTLPADTRAAEIVATVDASGAARRNLAPRITIRVNGIVVAHAIAGADRPTVLSAKVRDSDIWTHNRIDIAINASAPACAARACDLGDVRLIGNPFARLGGPPAIPVDFSQSITRFRAGIAVSTERPEDAPFAARAIRAVAPHAPLRPDGPARIVIAQKPPAGSDPALRFDTGAVRIEDKDGRLLYDQSRLDQLTVVQLVEAGSTPVLWVRPGSNAKPPASFDLDFGTVALFDSNGRAIAFTPDRDLAVRIVYAGTAERLARETLYTRLGLIAFWLIVSLGFFIIVRRMPPLRPAEA